MQHKSNDGHGSHGQGPAVKDMSVKIPGNPEHTLAVGGNGADRFGGAAGADHFWGLNGRDALGGGIDNDVLDGGRGSDLLSGNAGMDLLVGGQGDDILFGGPGGDDIRGGPGDDYIDEGAGHSGIDGGKGDDILVGGPGPDAFIVHRGSGDDVILDFTAGPGMGDHLALHGIRWDDLSFDETRSGVRVVWDGGSALLAGVEKRDLAQDDFMFFDAPDLPPGSRAPDGPAPEAPTPSVAGPEIRGASPSLDSGLLPSGGEGPSVFAFDDYRVTIGTTGPDKLLGSKLQDHMFGREGDDQMDGKGGDDVLDGGAVNDRLVDDEGQDRLEGGDGDDTLISGAGNDGVMGGDGNDVLDEGEGHGMLEGGRGDDVLVGGDGADAFMVSPDSGHDVVRDFVATGDAQGAYDHIAFRDIDAADLTIEDTDRGVLVSWDVEGGDGSVLLEGVLKNQLRQSDFMFDTPQFVAGINDYGSWYIFA